MNAILPRNTPLKRTAIKKRRSKPRPSLKVYADGREVYNLNTSNGRALYAVATSAMERRQGHICCLAGIAPMCPVTLLGYRTTFDHENGRGMGGGKRDDRIEVDGKRQNGAAHLECNQWKGSRFIPYNNPAALSEWKRKNLRSGSVYLATISEDASL